MDRVYSPYDHTNDYGFRCKKEEPKNYIVPSDALLWKPFKEIGLSDVKVIIVTDPPYNGSIATGIPLDINLNLYPELTDDDSTLQESVSYYHTDLGIIDLYFNNDRFNEQITVDVNDWMNQGVLLLPCAWTCTSQDRFAHVDLWKAFMSELLGDITRKLEDSVCKVPILAIGEGRKVLSDVNFGNFIIRMGGLIDAERSITEMKTIKPFDQINDYLDRNGIKKIKWI